MENPIQHIKEESEQEELPICLICRDDIEGDVCPVGCKDKRHVMHNECFHTHIASKFSEGNDVDCPYCREIIGKEQISQLPITDLAAILESAKRSNAKRCFESECEKQGAEQITIISNVRWNLHNSLEQGLLTATVSKRNSLWSAGASLIFKHLPSFFAKHNHPIPIIDRLTKGVAKNWEFISYAGMAFYFVNQYGVYSIRKAEMDGKIKIFENLESNEYKVEEMEAHKISYKRKALKGQVLAPFAIAGISYCGINVLMGNELLASNKTALYFSGLLGALTHECAYRRLEKWHEAHKPRFSDQIEIGFSNDEHQFQYTFSRDISALGIPK